MTVDLKRGKTIYENIEEYPLPQKPGVKDYVFYCFLSSDDEYEKAARKFFEKYYENHIAKSAKSLEEIVDRLHSEIRLADQIREIVIVCHANIRELTLPVTKHAHDNEENKSKYQVVRSGTLVNLQEAFGSDDPALADFKAKRKEVIRKLTGTSRVTIRACKFGISRDGLFALYSFFGGRANVYAPNEYQFFLDELGIGVDEEKLRLGVGSRLNSDLGLYQHLVKQGFIPRKTKHSDSRRVNIVRNLIEPGRGMNRFELSGYTIQNNTVIRGNKDEHDLFIKAFNQERVSGETEERFLQEQLKLSGEGSIRVIRQDEEWKLRDEWLRIKINDKTHNYKIDYNIRAEYEHFSDNENHKTSLYVYPVLNHRKSLPSIPVQLFFNDDQNKEFNGEIFELAKYATIPGHELDIATKENYEAYIKLLDEGNPGDDNRHKITTAFKNGHNITLTNFGIKQLSPENNRSRWEIQDRITVVIKEVVENISQNEQRISLNAEYERMVEFSAYWIVNDQAEGKKDYDSYLKLLDEGKMKDGDGRNIFRDIMGETFKTKNARIIQLPPEDGKKRWEFQCSIHYEIKDSFYYIHPKGFMNALKVIAPVTRAKRLEFYASKGNDPDTPGTELMAYLDNRSLEELFDLICFLRNPYKEEHAFYIHMAQQAMLRKPDLTSWPPYREEFKNNAPNPDPLFWGPSFITLSGLEKADKGRYAYGSSEHFSFPFNYVWQETKISSSENKEFNDDLFEEQKLPFPAVTIENVMDPDSPINDPDIMERDINNPEGTPDPPTEIFGGKEMVFEEITIPQEDLSCQKFKEALEILKENQGKSWEEIEQILRETEIIDSSTTLYEYLTDFYGFNSFKFANEMLQLFSPYASRPGIVGRLGRLSLSRQIFRFSLFFGFAEILLIYKDMLKEKDQIEKNNINIGIITGLKEGSGMILDIINRYENEGIHFADSYDFLSNAPDHLDRYKTFSGDNLLFFMNEFLIAHEEGYEVGLQEVEKIVNENLRRYERIFKQHVMDQGLKECHFKELLNSELIDEDKVKRALLEGLRNEILKIARYELVFTE
jgi:hypothetical protein